MEVLFRTLLCTYRIIAPKNSSVGAHAGSSHLLLHPARKYTRFLLTKYAVLRHHLLTNTVIHQQTAENNLSLILTELITTIKYSLRNHQLMSYSTQMDSTQIYKQ